jgi:glycosyltransferase involved in cell wall biosynthesis
LGEFASLPSPESFRHSYPDVKDRKLIVHLGRVNFKKGLDILVGAFAKVATQRDDVHLVIAGPDNEGYSSRVQNWLRRLNLRHRATFTGMLHGKDRLAALHAAAVFALPSYSENFGIAVVEAMACGCPVVVSNKVNIWREIEAAGAGLVVPCEVTACADALLRILDDAQVGQLMGRKGRALTEARYDWKAVGVELEMAYRDVLRKTIASPSC